MKYRFAQHDLLARTGKEGYLYNAMRKYGDRIIVQTLLEADEDYCLDIENKLRPSPRIGWNAGIGGQNTMRGYKHSEQSKQRMSDASKTKGTVLCREHVQRRAEARKSLCIKRTDESKARQSANKIALAAPPWTNPAAVLPNWAQAGVLESMLGDGNRECDILRHFKLDRRSTTFSVIIRKIKAGWSPSADPAFQSWLSQYKQKECNESTHTKQVA